MNKRNLSFLLNIKRIKAFGSDTENLIYFLIKALFK